MGRIWFCHEPTTPGLICSERINNMCTAPHNIFNKCKWQRAYMPLPQSIDAIEPDGSSAEVVRCRNCAKRYTEDCGLYYGKITDKLGYSKKLFCGNVLSHEYDDFFCAAGAKMV